MRKQPDEDYLEFARALNGHLFRTASLLTVDRHLAEDLVQETLGKMFVAWPKISRIDNPNGYAHTVLVRSFLSHQRRRSSAELPTDRIPERAGPAADPTLRLTLLEALGCLAPKDRAVLVLRYWEDRSVEQVADVLGLSAGAVRNQSMRALAKLRVALGEELGELAAS